MSGPRFCSECGAKVSLFGTCTINPDHNPEAGGFWCPECGDPTSGDEREGKPCFGCRSQE